MHQTFGVATLIRTELKPFEDRIELAFLFGSMVDGLPRPDSDVDLMVVGNLEIFELGEPVARIQLALGRTLDLNLYTPAEWAALSDDRVIRAIMKSEKLAILG